MNGKIKYNFWISPFICLNIILFIHLLIKILFIYMFFFKDPIAWLAVFLLYQIIKSVWTMISLILGWM